MQSFFPIFEDEEAVILASRILGGLLSAGRILRFYLVGVTLRGGQGASFRDGAGGCIDLPLPEIHFHLLSSNHFGTADRLR